MASLDLDLPPVPTSYQRTDDFVGSISYQLALPQVHLRLSLGDFLKIIERPDPARRFDHNRRIDVGHAKDFAAYLLRGVKDRTPEHKHQPLFPAVYLFTDAANVSIDKFYEVPGERFAIIKLDRRGRVSIWDGQHRTLGAFIANDELDSEITKARDHLEASKEMYSGPEAVVIDEAQARYDELIAARDRLLEISIPLVLTLTSDRKRVAAIFSDLNDKQKGMNASVVTRLDDRVVFNRVAANLAAHEYLEGLVDDEADYTTGSNPHWISLRDLAAVAKLCWLGYGGRWNDSRESAVSDQQVEAQAVTFIETLVAAFPDDLGQVLDSRTLEPSELRRDGSNTSLLSSATMIKALAVAYYDLLDGKGFTVSGKRVKAVDGLPAMTPEEVKAAFANLPPMDSGEGVLAEEWLDVGVFEAPFVAPTARGANVRTLAIEIMKRARS